jgi:hypothetical protein
MKIPAGRIEDLCSESGQERVIEECRLERSKDANEPGIGWLIATNGKALGVVQVDLVDDDTNGPVSVDAIKMARKQSKRIRELANLLTVNSVAKVLTKTGIVEMSRTAYPDRSFPNVDAVMPKKEEADVVLHLDAKLLYTLAEAIGDDSVYHHQVSLYLKTEKGKDGGPRTVSSGIYVEQDINKPTGFGVIMPCSKAK